MAGTLAVPSSFATQSGQVPASQLDDNNAAIVAYVNLREISSGTLAARPTTPTAGLWYFANNENGGTLYFGNGSTWVRAALGLTAGVTAPVTVAQGGTGAQGLTSNAVLVGMGATASVTLIALDTAGALLVGQSSGPPAALAVGANSEVLVADSTVAGGLRYGNAGASEMVFNDAGGALGAGATIYLGPWAANPNNPNNPVVNRIMTRPGILSELFVWANGPPGGGQSFTFTVMKNGIATPLAVGVTGSVDRTGNSTSQTVIVQPGDTVTLRAVGSAGAVSGIASTAQLSFYPLR